ncbi:hypothetical protein TNIN_204291 [Trichonephila inaurata madagascariensis]|uniref:Uncharacterized protein n=1 Tax=Trichonephila inaurata madagascariensis TaxID=2747483 RepID=A0A8X6XP16_9ARAC|nr:hypothetical protein TNIN_204291 [Trichonephila inaurata madagascariensis]
MAQLRKRHKVGQSLTRLCIQNNEEEWSISSTKDSQVRSRPDSRLGEKAELKAEEEARQFSGRWKDTRMKGRMALEESGIEEEKMACASSSDGCFSNGRRNKTPLNHHARSVIKLSLGIISRGKFVTPAKELGGRSELYTPLDPDHFIWTDDDVARCRDLISWTGPSLACTDLSEDQEPAFQVYSPLLLRLLDPA